MAWEVLVESIFSEVTAILILAVAAFVLFLDFPSAVHRAFAFLLLIRALGFALYPIVNTDLGLDLRPYLFIALPFAAAHFAIVYRRRHGSSSRRPTWVAPVVLAVAAFSLEAVYLADHTTFADWDAGRLGPLGVFAYFDTPALAFTALLFAFETRRATSQGARSALLSAALGLSIPPLFYSSFRVADLVLDTWRGVGHRDVFEVIETAMILASFAAVATTIVLSTAARKASGQRFTVSIALWSLAFASGAALAPLFVGEQESDYAVLASLNAVWTLALPILVTYALVRYRLFDAEVRLRFAIKGTTLAAFFVATFFVVAKLAEQGAQKLFEDNNYNWAIGAAATGLLLFAISPLQKLAERLAQRAVPGNRPMLDLPHADRVRLYREQLEVAWADGHLTSKERLLFTTLQQRLGLSADEAQALEAEVLATLTAAKPSRRRAGTAG